MAAVGVIAITGLVGSPPAADADVVLVGGECSGVHAGFEACVWINYDNTLGRFRAHAQIWDRADDTGYQVAVHTLEFCSSRGCTTHPDFDGWYEDTDSVQSPFGGCPPARDVRVRANFSTFDPLYGEVPFRTLAAEGTVCN
jgi:hypothetical protein